VEATGVAPDGTYRLAGVGPDDEIVIETPGYRVTAPLSVLTDGIVAA
jgi:hypothetical protein